MFAFFKQLINSSNQGENQVSADFPIDVFFKTGANGPLEQFYDRDEPADLELIENYLLTQMFLCKSPKLLNARYQELKKQGWIRFEFSSIFDVNENIAEVIIRGFFNQNYKQKFTKLINQYCDIELLKKLPHDQIRQLLEACMYYASLAQNLLPKLNQLVKMQILDGGLSKDTWSMLADNLFAKGNVSFKKDHQSTTMLKGLEQIIHADENTLKPENGSLTFQIKGWKFLRFQGRTIIFENAEKKLLAVKVQKKQEDTDELLRQFHTDRFFKNNASELDIKSKLPQAISVIKLDDVDEWLKSLDCDEESKKAFLKMIADPASNPAAYVYEVDADNHGYFTYLHDANMEDEEFAAANRVAVNDLYKLLLHGFVFDRLADIFHVNKGNSHANGRPDRGRYQTLVNLVTDCFRGNGRIDAWQLSVAFVNIRAFGLADLGDWRKIEELTESSEFAKTYYEMTLEKFGEKAGDYILANLMAEYQLVLELVAGSRGFALTAQAKAQGLGEKEINEIWIKLANQMVDNCAQAVSICTGVPEDVARRFLENCINIQNYAAQMRLWMTDEYIDCVVNESEEKLKQIYDKDTKIEIVLDMIRKGTFTKENGFAMDGKNYDLGTCNGQEPVKEGNKLFYNMIIAMHVLKDCDQTKVNGNGQSDKSMCPPHLSGDQYSSKFEATIAKAQRRWRVKKHQKRVNQACGTNDTMFKEKDKTNSNSKAEEEIHEREPYSKVK